MYGQRKIALEEHFALRETVGHSHQYASVDRPWSDLERRLLDLEEERLAHMDAYGIELAILSLNAPAVQAIQSPEAAVQTARDANNLLAEVTARHPARLRGFGALPMQDPATAVLELTRVVEDLGFEGVLVNGFSQLGQRAVYYDDPIYEPFWMELERLEVPFYLHPRDPLPEREPIYEGHPWFLGSAWAFGVETSMHALRLAGSGLFDRHPRLTIILGHLGEGLPYNVWRLDHRLEKSPRGIPARRSMIEYLRSNFFLTTSGNFRTPTLLDAIAELGSDRILFSVDYPFEEVADAVGWFDRVEMSDADRLKIARTNAVRLFKLDRAPVVPRMGNGDARRDVDQS